MRFAFPALACLAIHASSAYEGWNSGGGGGRPTKKPTGRPNSQDWVWNGWPNNPWTGDGWNSLKFPTRMPTTSHPTTSTPTSHPMTSTPTSHPTTSTTSTPTSHPTTSTPMSSPTTAAPSIHPSVSPTIESTSAPSISISLSTHPSTSPSVVPSIHPSISSFPSTSPSASSEPSVSSFPSISPSVSSRPSTSILPSSSSAPSIAYFAAAQSRQGSSVVFNDMKEWLPNCTLTEEECKRVFCDGVRNNLQNQLCTNGPGQNYSPCNVGVVCNPREINLALGDTTTSNAVVRAVGTSWEFLFHITYVVACNDPQCTDQVALTTRAAYAYALYRTALGKIQQEQYLIELDQALAALETQSSTATEYFSTFTFEYDPTNSTLVTPPITKSVQKDLGDYELVGVGDCTDSFGEIFSYISYKYGPGITSDQECILRCKNSACLNSQGYTLVGIVTVPAYEKCYCIAGNAYDTYPKNDSPECADVYSGHNELGTGTVINVDGNSNFLCFRPKVLI